MKYINLFVASALIICLLPMPYGYYTIVRFVVMVVFIVYAFLYYEKKSISLAFTFGTLALLFQPFCKITLGKGLWNIVDIVVAFLLAFLWYKENNND